MSLRDVPDEELVPGVTRLRHVELGTELIYVASDVGFVWAREEGEDEAYAVHINDIWAAM